MATRSESLVARILFYLASLPDWVDFILIFLLGWFTYALYRTWKVGKEVNETEG